MDEDIIELIARTIFEFESGLTPEEFEEVAGVSKRQWIAPSGIFYPDMSLDYLDQWERDEYIFQAKMILEELYNKNYTIFKANKIRIIKK
jgi:hypothetical protein